MTKGTRLAQQAKDEASLNTSASRRRKRTARDASLDGSGDVEADTTTTLQSRKNKKRNENCIPRLPYPDPTIDKTLSQQSRRALSYAYERCQRAGVWKFNKARQNWLLRNIWSDQAVPGSYVPLVIEYLADIKGGAREKLIAMCTSILSAIDDGPVQQSTQSFDGSTDVRSTVDERSSTSRALSILNVLGENQNHKFN